MTRRTPHEHSCSHCAGQLSSNERDGIGYLSCSGCRGIWIEQGAFSALLRYTQPDAPTELMVHNDGSPRTACPMCREQMDIAWLDFFQVQQCEAHGVWVESESFEGALSGGDPGGDVRKKVEQRFAEQDRKAGSAKVGWAALASFFLGGG